MNRQGSFISWQIQPSTMRNPAVGVSVEGCVPAGLFFGLAENSGGGSINEATMPEVRVQDVLLPKIHRRVRVPKLSKRVATVDRNSHPNFFFVLDQKHFLTCLQRFTKKYDMISREYLIPLSPRPGTFLHGISTGEGFAFSHTPTFTIQHFVTPHTFTKQQNICYQQFQSCKGGNTSGQINEFKPSNRQTKPFQRTLATLPHLPPLSLFLPPHVTVVTRSLPHHENRPQNNSVEGPQWAAMETGRLVCGHRRRDSLRQKAPRPGLPHYTPDRPDQSSPRHDVGMAGQNPQYGPQRQRSLAAAVGARQ